MKNETMPKKMKKLLDDMIYAIEFKITKDELKGNSQLKENTDLLKMLLIMQVQAKLKY